jgi:hypothetical protein
MRALVPILCAVALLCAALPAWAQDDSDVDAFARVIVAETALRSGPGVSHRVIYHAHRGDTFLIQGRAGAGFWLQVVLPDGRVGYVLGDTIETVGAGPGAPEGAVKPGFFAPPALEEAHGGFALCGGVFDRDGYVEFKPALVLAPAVSVEPYIGLAMQTDARRLVYGLGASLDLAPDWAVAPYVTLGAGGLRDQPSANLHQSPRNFFQARAGGGLLVSLRWRILFRFEATNTIVFTEDSYKNVQSYIGGLGTYF